MKILTGFEQGSLEWLAARAGRVTASEADALISPLWKIRESRGVDTYLAQKLAEKWLGGTIPGYQSTEMEIGAIQERESYNWLALEYGWEISRPALITTDDGKCACSPDGLCDNFGIEIKSPGPLNHVKYVLANAVPDEYRAQVQFSLYVTQMPKWVFVSYRRDFPNLVLSVTPDPLAQNNIHEAVTAFLARLDGAMQKLIQLNGGQPPKPNPFREALLRPRENEETADLIP